MYSSLERTPGVQVCGAIASGKTTIVRAMSDYGFTPVFENPADVPYLERFYADPSGYAYETEVSFLLQHYSNIKHALRDRTMIASDYAILQDMAYADVTLDERQQEAFGCLAEDVIRQIGAPTLLIRLECDYAELLRRIAHRNRCGEEAITEKYLCEVDKALSKRISEQVSEESVIVINSGDVDFANEKNTRDIVLTMITNRCRTLLHKKDNI